MGVLISQREPRRPRGIVCLFSKVRERGRRGFFLLSLGFWLLGQGWNAAHGQTISHEYPLKAVFLLNFAQFTVWPTNAFEQPDSPFVIGILGKDPFGALLDDAVRNETVNGRKFVVERFRRVEDIKTCHILFICQSEAPHLDKILADVKEMPTLTVSEIEGTPYRGVGVRFITENNKIRLRINLEEVKKANLTISSQLLRLAEIVSTAR